MKEIKTTDTNASDLLQFHLYAIKEYETSFLKADPMVNGVYRYIGLYRLLNAPSVVETNCSWVAQAIIEAEMRRDNVIIDTSEQLDAYCDDFVYSMGLYNKEFETNEALKRVITLAFNNIYDMKGFNDETDCLPR